MKKPARTASQRDAAFKAIAELDSANTVGKLWADLREFRKLEWKLYRKSLIVEYLLALLAGLAVSVPAIISGLAPSEYAEQFRQTVGLVFQYVITMMGLLLIGFSVLPSVSRDSFLCALAEQRNKETGMLWGRYIFLNFVNAFAYFLTYTLVITSLYFIGLKSGLASTVVNALFSGSKGELIKRMCVALAFCSLISGLFLSFIRLKTFIFNLYRVIMFFIGFILYEELESEDDPERATDKE